MAKIILDSIALHYPIYSTSSQSIKKSLLNITTGGTINLGTKNIITIQALNDISFTLDEGDRLGLIGHNGAGKSSLLKTLAQIYTPTSGTLSVEGKVCTLLNIALGMDDNATGYENIILKGLLQGLTRKEVSKLLPEIEEFCELGNFLSMPIKVYSAGMKLRLAFAISTCVIPEILLMDEVISVGDSYFMEKASNRIKHILNKASIIVLASHSTKILKDICNKLIVLEHGKIKFAGNIDDVLKQYKGYTQVN